MFIRRDLQEAYDRIYKDYFAEESICNETHLWRRFWMRKHLFLRTIDALQICFKFFQLRTDALMRRGFLHRTKCTAAIRMLAYVILTNCVDKILEIW